jgi:hypothetical protein
LTRLSTHVWLQVGGIMSDARSHDRRARMVHASLKPGSRLCRLCLRVVVLEPEYIEMTDQYVYVRCPHCRGSFPIRHSDIEMFLGAEAPST